MQGSQRRAGVNPVEATGVGRGAAKLIEYYLQEITVAYVFSLGKTNHENFVNSVKCLMY